MEDIVDFFTKVLKNADFLYRISGKSRGEKHCLKFLVLL